MRPSMISPESLVPASRAQAMAVPLPIVSRCLERLVLRVGIWIPCLVRACSSQSSLGGENCPVKRCQWLYKSHCRYQVFLPHQLLVVVFAYDFSSDLRWFTLIRCPQTDYTLPGLVMLIG